MSRGNLSQPETPGYSYYTLGVLVVVYVLNFVDRQILSILNEDIKRDLGLGDAQMGFLYGTAFAVFYAVFGLPLGRLADVWVRRSLVAAALAFWSAATAVSGLARNFLELGAARIAVGVGEAGTGPCAYSILSDSFPAARRATVVGILTSGVYVGAGIGVLIGGQVVQRWNEAFAEGTPPMSLAGWQIAFFVVGLPGLFVALWVRSLREPERGAMDGISSPKEAHPFREFGREIAAVIPGLTLLQLHRGGGGRASIALNLGVATGLGLAAWSLIATIGNAQQWIALAIGVYATFSWTQRLALRDPPTAALILRTRSWVLAVLGFGTLGFSTYGVTYFGAPFFLRFHSIPIGELGVNLGSITAIFGFIGVILGGLLADAWRVRNPRGRLYVAILTALIPVPTGMWMLYTPSADLAYALYAAVVMASAGWLGIGGSTIQDLVLPRMRGSATAVYILSITLLGLALGPFTVGFVSDATGDLRVGLTVALLMNLVATGFIGLAAQSIEQEEGSLLERARLAGEPAGL